MIRRKLILAAATFAAVFVIVEVAATVALGSKFRRGVIPRLTWSDAGQREPERGWAMRPGLRAEIIGPHPPYDVALDSRGYRQPERSSERANGAARVLALGDSLLFGWGVQADERCMDLVGAALERQLGRPVEVWNLATPGYSTDQELWTYEMHGRALRPDVVVLCVAMNDVPIAETATFRTLGKPRLVQEGERWVRREAPPDVVVPRQLPLLVRASRWSALAAWLRLRREPPPDAPFEFPARVPWNERGARAIADATAAQAAKFLDPSAPVHEALRRLAEELRADGVPLVLMSMPFNHDPYLMDPRFDGPPEGRLEGALSRTIRALAAQIGAECVTVDEALGREAAAGVLLHVGDGHPNPRANELMAEALEPVLARLLKRS
ncbi:MAG: SGNH/GDSL hydrolase family protein [Planctomycetota bacterium]